jgi:hypothetical protein
MRVVSKNRSIEGPNLVEVGTKGSGNGIFEPHIAGDGNARYEVELHKRPGLKSDLLAQLEYVGSSVKRQRAFETSHWSRSQFTHVEGVIIDLVAELSWKVEHEIHLNISH